MLELVTTGTKLIKNGYTMPEELKNRAFNETELETTAFDCFYTNDIPKLRAVQKIL